MESSSPHSDDIVSGVANAPRSGSSSPHKDPTEPTSQPEEADPPVRVGVLLRSGVQPAWIERSLTLVAESRIARIDLVATITTTNTNELPSRARLIHRLLRIDRQLFRRQPDAMQPVDLLAQDEFASIPHIAVDGDLTDLRSAIRAANIDILLCPGTALVGREMAGEVRRGVWYFPEVEAAIAAGLPTGFDATVRNAGRVTTSLREISADGSTERVVYTSTSAANAYSPHYTERRVLWKMATFPIRALERYRWNDLVHKDLASDVSATSQIPGTIGALFVAVRLMSRLARFTIRSLISRSEWSLAIRNDAVLTVESLQRANPRGAYQPIPNPPGAFWADPFPVVDGDRRWLFVEEFPDAAKRAHIAVMEILSDGSLGPSTVVLSLPWHLSYPYVFRDGDTWYMIPEMMEHRTVDLYRSTSFPFEWVHEKTLFDDIDAVDTTVIEIDGWWWLFATIAPYGGSENDDLHIYRARSPRGPWEPIPGNPQISDIRRGRCAGRIFELDGCWYRPAQDCTGRYGAAMTINRIVGLSENGYAEEFVGRIDPTWDNGLLGTHTFNHIPGFTVIDGDRWRSRWRK